MKKTYFGLLIIAVFVSLYSLLMNQFSNGTSQNEKEQQIFFAHKFLDHDQFHCVLAGDSRVYRGLNPVAFEKTLGIKTINLGYDSAGYGPDFFQLIDDRLSKESPRYLIIGISPHSFTPRATSNGQLVEYEKMPPAEARSILHPTLLDKYFPAISLRKLQKHNNEDAGDKALIEEHFSNGFAPAQMKKNDPTEAVKSYTAIFKEQTFSQDAEDLLIKKVKEYTSSGVTVFGVRMPTSKEIHTVEDELSGFNEQEFVTRFQSNGGHWVKIPTKNYETFDGSHLVPSSADQI